MVDGAVVDLGGRLGFRHRCAGYCRGDRHADVLWCDPSLVPAGSEVDSLREVARALGVTFVHAEPAGEAQRPVGVVGAFTPGDGSAGVGFVGGDHVPWLLVFALPAGTGADDAAPAGEREDA